MSLRTLFSTSTSALTSAVNGTVKLGSVVGDATEWLARHSSQLNSKDTIRMEELRRKQERTTELCQMFETSDSAELKQSIKDLEDFYDEIFK